MSVLISDVERGSIAERHGIRAGEKLLAINGHEIIDVLDYRFYIVDTHLKLELEDARGEARTVSLRKKEYDDPGLCFDTYLIDKKHSCRNHCIFCFIDQLPKGLRGSLYFKDDDERLSFLMGNYITLTNLSEREVSRIIDMHLSPVNISVHTTNPDLRVRMMNNNRAGEALGILRRLADAGTRINCQIVLCRGYNDGVELERTMRDLGDMYPSVGSVAVVPVGLTRYREGLCGLEPFSGDDARKVVGQIETFGGEFLKKHGTRLVYPADEFYLKAGKMIPDEDFYEGFAQIENGVGMISMFRGEFESARMSAPREDKRVRSVSVATGVAAYPLISSLAETAAGDIAKLDCKVYAINNELFGENITVAGLVTGQDIIKQLRGRSLGSELLIPENMLRSQGDMFLDDTTPDDVGQALGVRVRTVANDGGEFFDALVGQ
jgi:putative radical SAM enzyme (TIGR03279 family)